MRDINLAATRDMNQAIGKADGLLTCENGDCGCTAHDIVDEYKGVWLVECFVCGLKVRMRAVKGVKLAENHDEFVFRDGRFAGMTISDVYRGSEVGTEYVEWAAESHPRNFVRAACRAWVDSISKPQ